jgi:LysM repeat protein
VLPGTPLPGCVVRAEWEIYTIVAGDTLSSLALRTNATVAELMTANCLSDPNLIQVGQTLVVPRPPDPITATPPPTATEG